MSNGKSHSPVQSNELTHSTVDDDVNQQRSRVVQRRSFLKGLAITGAAATAAPLLSFADSGDPDRSGSLTNGDAAILRFLAAAEIIESDIWLQYQELAGIQDDEVARLASRLIPGYPNKATGGNAAYTADIAQLDPDMSQYIHDNTEDELSHETFLNHYLVSKGADPVSLDAFRALTPSQATGSNKTFGRITNLMQLTVHTDWWTRYRARRRNPDFGDTFRDAIATLAVNQHTAVPRTDADTTNSSFLQAVANTAGFHFAWIEQGGSSLYPQLAQRVTNVEVLRILLSIGGTEICHFQTWHDKAGNAPVLTNIVDPVTGVSVTFPDLNNPPFGGQNFQTNLIMPEPTEFLSKDLPKVSIIRPTETVGAAMGAVNSLTEDGLFIGQSKKFFQFLQDLAADADAARRGRH